MKFILGKKVGMSRVFREEKAIPVTLLSVDPCYISQIKTDEKDGYQAVQVSYGKKKNITKPIAGHIKKAKIKDSARMVEFRVDSIDGYKLGQELGLTMFEPGEKVRVSAISKGKGFTGVMKRHGFSGSPKTHGHRHDERAPGSIGAGFPQHVFKGIRMAGRSGTDRVSIKNLEVIEIDKDNSLLAVQGSIPGARNAMVEIVAPGEIGQSEDKKSTDDKSEKK